MAEKCLASSAPPPPPGAVDPRVEDMGGGGMEPAAAADVSPGDGSHTSSELEMKFDLSSDPKYLYLFSRLLPALQSACATAERLCHPVQVDLHEKEQTLYIRGSGGRSEAQLHTVTQLVRQLADVRKFPGHETVYNQILANFSVPPALHLPTLRDVVVDCNNVAMHHGISQRRFSWRGVEIVYEFFFKRGHKVYMVAPGFRKYRATPEGRAFIDKMEQAGFLKFISSREPKKTSYDDRFLLEICATLDGVIISNDRYSDLAHLNDKWLHVIRNRIIDYIFVDDKFIPATDPQGRDGLSLDELLIRSRPVGPRSDLQHDSTAEKTPCPYGIKCNFGKKCKYYHDTPKESRAARTRRLQKTLGPKSQEAPEKQAGGGGGSGSKHGGGSGDTSGMMAAVAPSGVGSSSSSGGSPSASECSIFRDHFVPPAAPIRTGAAAAAVPSQFQPVYPDSTLPSAPRTYPPMTNGGGSVVDHMIQFSRSFSVMAQPTVPLYSSPVYMPPPPSAMSYEAFVQESSAAAAAAASSFAPIYYSAMHADGAPSPEVPPLVYHTPAPPGPPSMTAAAAAARAMMPPTREPATGSREQPPAYQSISSRPAAAASSNLYTTKAGEVEHSDGCLGEKGGTDDPDGPPPAYHHQEERGLVIGVNELQFSLPPSGGDGGVGWFPMTGESERRGEDESDGGGGGRDDQHLSELPYRLEEQLSLQEPAAAANLLLEARRRLEPGLPEAEVEARVADYAAVSAIFPGDKDCQLLWVMAERPGAPRKDIVQSLLSPETSGGGGGGAVEQIYRGKHLLGSSSWAQRTLPHAFFSTPHNRRRDPLQNMRDVLKRAVFSPSMRDM